MTVWILFVLTNSGTLRPAGTYATERECIRARLDIAYSGAGCIKRRVYEDL